MSRAGNLILLLVFVGLGGYAFGPYGALACGAFAGLLVAAVEMFERK